MARNRGRGRKSTPGGGAFDPTDTTRVTHTRIGVWDLYEARDTAAPRVPGASTLERAWDAYACLPYLARMVADVLSIRSCWFLLLAYGAAEVVSSLLPAAALW